MSIPKLQPGQGLIVNKLPKEIKTQIVLLGIYMEAYNHEGILIRATLQEGTIEQELAELSEQHTIASWHETDLIDGVYSPTRARV